jgi:hypothetical protein
VFLYLASEKMLGHGLSAELRFDEPKLLLLELDG